MISQTPRPSILGGLFIHNGDFLEMKKCISCGMPIEVEKLDTYPDAKICIKCISDVTGEMDDNTFPNAKKSPSDTLNSIRSDADECYIDDAKLALREYEEERQVDALMMAPTGWEDDKELQESTGIEADDEC